METGGIGCAFVEQVLLAVTHDVHCRVEQEDVGKLPFIDPLLFSGHASVCVWIVGEHSQVLKSSAAYDALLFV